MEYSIVFIEKGNHLLCISHGKVSSVDDYLAWAKDIMEGARRTGNKVLLLDNRTFELHLTAHEVVLFADRLDERGAAKLGLRIGVISCPNNPEVSRLVETSLVNRSATYKSFRSQSDAMEWLKI